MTTVTVELRDEVRAAIDQVRGEQDVAAFLATAGERAAMRRLVRHAPRADELTPADHIRMAAEAEADSLPIEEFRQLVMTQIAADADAEARAS
ncbi:MAG: hypothetical protein DLM69_08570 [Candidatus Chloroheliales bacterium]|nr:MAG: hypothetical protein DLM69_08570 [Chloroflexota bacterium]